MKINENELSFELQQKVNILQNIKKNNNSGYLYYDGKDFSSKEITFELGST